MQIDAASVTAKHMAEVWADGCRRHHKFEPLPLTGKTAGQFRPVIRAFKHVGVHPMEGLAAIVGDWWSFCEAAQHDAAAKGSPSKPNIDFLTTYRELSTAKSPSTRLPN